METLSPEEQLLLEAASVAGREFVAERSCFRPRLDGRRYGAACARLSPARGHLSATRVCSNGPAEASPRDSVSFTLSIARRCIGRVPAGRRSRLHRLIGEELEKAYGAQADANANQLARHFRYGGDHPRAIRYFRLAAEQALRRSAHREAVSLLQCGLELVEQQPETPERHSEEFAFRSMMAPAMLAVKGFAAPEAVLNFQRARELGLRLVRVEEMYQLLFHLAGDARTSRRIPAGGTDSG